MNIKQIRLSKNMTQKQLAEAIGVDHTVISKYESGLVSPPADKLEAMAKVLGVQADELLRNNNVEEPVSHRRRASINVVTDRDLMYISRSLVVKKLITYTNGKCELCGCQAPFMTEDGLPYLESHYVKWLSQGGLPTIENLVVLCPNCHQKMHTICDPDDQHKLEEIAKKHDLEKIL